MAIHLFKYNETSMSDARDAILRLVVFLNFTTRKSSTQDSQSSEGLTLYHGFKIHGWLPEGDPFSERPSLPF
jgi:hypothetical protein